MYYNHKNTGRPATPGRGYQKYRSNYFEVTNDPVYPFGYGLNYTTFSYSGFKLSANKMDINNGRVTATITVKNTGERDGDEIVQLYIRDMAGSITRPVKELKGFKRIHLKKGESREVSFEITPDMLKFYNYNLDYVCEPGEFQIMAGSSSEDTSKAMLTVE